MEARLCEKNAEPNYQRIADKWFCNFQLWLTPPLGCICRSNSLPLKLKPENRPKSLAWKRSHSKKTAKNITYGQARSQDLEKGGGYFERVRSVQTTLTWIFIDLESVLDGLSETWGEMSRKARKFKAFFRLKLGDLQKKKKKKKRKGLRQNSEWFFGRNPKFKGFFCPELGDLQTKRKKKVFTKIEAAISSNFANSDVWGGLFSNGGGYFPFFT